MEAWRLPQTLRRPGICRDCLAEHNGVLNYADASPDAAWTNTIRTMADYLQGVPDNGFDVPALVAVIGFHISMMLDDNTMIV